MEEELCPKSNFGLLDSSDSNPEVVIKHSKEAFSFWTTSMKKMANVGVGGLCPGCFDLGLWGKFLYMYMYTYIFVVS